MKNHCKRLCQGSISPTYLRGFFELFFGAQIGQMANRVWQKVRRQFRLEI